MNRRGLEISMANPVNETISYQTHYVAESRRGGRGWEGRLGKGGGRVTPGKRHPQAHRDLGLAGEPHGYPSPAHDAASLYRTRRFRQNRISISRGES